MIDTQTPLPAPCEGTPGRGPDEVSGPSLNTSVPGEVVTGPLTSMPPDRAAWVRDNAWPAWMRAMNNDYPGRGCFLLHMCACELGVCVPCSQDHRHDRCMSRGREPYGWDMAIYGLACCEKVNHAHSLATVTLAICDCRWRCPCGCWRERLPEAPPKVVKPVQLALDFAAVA